MMCITLNDIAQMLIAGTGVGTLIFTYHNTTMIQRQKNELELRNIAYDIIRKGAKLQEYMAGKFKYYVVRRALWDMVTGKIIPNCKPVRSANNAQTGSLVYYKDGELYQFDKEDTESLKRVENFIDEYADGVESLRRIPAQIIDFEEAVSCFEENAKYRFSRYEKLKFKLGEYTNSLNGFKTDCEKLVNDLNPIDCINDLAKAIEMDSNSETYVRDCACKINEYINNLLKGSETLDQLKYKADKAYEKLKDTFDKFLTQSERERRKPFDPNKEKDSSENQTGSEKDTCNV